MANTNLKCLLYLIQFYSDKKKWIGWAARDCFTYNGTGSSEATEHTTLPATTVSSFTPLCKKIKQKHLQNIMKTQFIFHIATVFFLYILVFIICLGLCAIFLELCELREVKDITITILWNRTLLKGTFVYN